MSITQEQLKGAYSEGEALAIYHELQREGDLLGHLRRHMHDEDYQVARNMLWGLTKATDQELEVLQPALHELIDLAMTTDNSSVRRLALNIVERQKIAKDDLRSDFLDWCLEHMVSMDEYPGTQSLCMKLAHRQCSFYPELMGELLRTVQEMEISYYGPAVKSVRNRILAGKLKRSRK